MATLIVGASGATGRLLTQQLLARGEQVRIIVRSTTNLPDKINSHENLSVIQANILDLGDIELVQHVSGCGAVASCLGHNLSLKGMYGHPRKLVTDATKRLCAAIKANEPNEPVKIRAYEHNREQKPRCRRANIIEPEVCSQSNSTIDSTACR